MSDVIRKADLAKEIGVSRSRVSQLCEAGLPVRPDGKLSRAEALKWVKENVDSSRGGWWGDMRSRKNQKARGVDTNEGLEGEMTQIDGRTLDNFLLGVLVADPVAGRLGQKGAKVTQLFAEPEWSEIARIAGETVDVEAWEKESQQCVDEWTTRVEIESAKPQR